MEVQTFLKQKHELADDNKAQQSRTGQLERACNSLKLSKMKRKKTAKELFPVLSHIFKPHYDRIVLS